MQCLASIAGLERSEPLSVSRAYLATPTLVGRDQPRSIFRRQLTLALSGRGSSLLVAAGAGLGRSRFLDVCVLDGKTSGAIVLRTGAHDAGSGRFGSARALAQQLLVGCPSLALSTARAEGVVDILFDNATASELEANVRVELRSWSVEPAQELAVQDALERWLLAICDKHPLLIAVDDAERVDPPSLALLAALAHRARRQHLLLCATAASTSLSDVPGLAVLASHSVKLALPALEPGQTEALLTSLFGDAANLAVLSERVHVLAAGRPRECMALAQHLVDRGLITYAAGIWTLPEQITTADLPASVEDVLRQRVAELSAEARGLATAQALAIFSEFTRDDYVQLAPTLSTHSVDALIDELVAREIVVGNGQRYTLSQPALCDALLAQLSDVERRAHHAALAELQMRSDKSQLAAVQHLLAAGSTLRALDLLAVVLRASADSAALSTAAEMRYADIAVVLERALDAALELGYPARELNELRRWLLLMGVVVDAKYYERVGPALVAQLERDSGLYHFRAAEAIQDPTARLTQALTQASQAYAAQPEHERVYRVDEAIANLVHYVVASIAVGASILDTRLIATLPALLEPFAALSPVLHAIWQNALATCDTLCLGRPERARQRWAELYQRLEHVTEQDLRHVTMVRNAVAFGLGTLEAQLGIDSADHWADILDRDPSQRVSAMYLRKTACMLRGDFAGAESFRRKAELLSLRATSSQMFTNLVGIELAVHASARDLTGVKRIRDRIAALAAKHPGWRVYRDLAEGLFKRLHGDLEGACASLEQALALCEPDPSDPSRVIAVWPRTASNYIEALIDRDQFEEARAFGQRVLRKCDELGMVVVRFEIERALALAEAMLGEQSAAEARLERIIAAQREFGVTGLNLGLSYEARARIAIWCDDRCAVEKYAQLTAAEYGHSRGSALGARYERLRLEAQSHGVTTLRPKNPVHDSGHASIGRDLDNAPVTVDSSLGQRLAAITDHTERAHYALQLLCAAHAARHGHLYLMRDGRLTYAATCGTDSPSAVVDAQVRAFWDTQLDDADLPTAFLPTNAWPSLSGATVWTTPDGTSLRPLILHCTLEGSSNRSVCSCSCSRSMPKQMPTRLRSRRRSPLAW
jgi:hypothetical protein